MRGYRHPSRYNKRCHVVYSLLRPRFLACPAAATAFLVATFAPSFSKPFLAAPFPVVWAKGAPVDALTAVMPALPPAVVAEAPRAVPTDRFFDSVEEVLLPPLERTPTMGTETAPELSPESEKAVGTLEVEEG